MQGYKIQLNHARYSKKVVTMMTFKNISMILENFKIVGGPLNGCQLPILHFTNLYGIQYLFRPQEKNISSGSIIF